MDSSAILAKYLVEIGYLKTPRIINAFKKIDRADFVLKKFKKEAYNNSPLPIGFGQTISQPQTVAFMLELLEPKEGNKILDIGSGSGWQTSLLSEIVGPKGKVFAIELIPELLEFGKQNSSKYDFVSSGIAQFISADGSKGLPDSAPFDRIIAAAAAAKIPQALNEQLKIGGRLVMPVKNSIWLAVRKNETEYVEAEFPGFAFVPLVEK